MDQRLVSYSLGNGVKSRLKQEGILMKKRWYFGMKNTSYKDQLFNVSNSRIELERLPKEINPNTYEDYDYQEYH